MSIRARVFGGFGLILLLTVAVAAIGWQSLTGFARRVDTANAAQTLAGEIGDLALAGSAIAADNIYREKRRVETDEKGRVKLSMKALMERPEAPPAQGNENHAHGGDHDGHHHDNGNHGHDHKDGDHSH